MFIEICGNIASGKTTLAKLLETTGNKSVFEDFHSNPFYKAFYSNPKLNSFETELTFHLQHYHAIKNEYINTSCVVFFDFSFLLDKAYADVTLSGKRLFLFSQVSEELEAEIGNPSAVIRLLCPEEILLQRIISRNREPEKSISIDYLKSLNSAIDNRINDLTASQSKINIIEIDSHKYDFANDANAQKMVLDIIQEKLLN